MTFEEIVQIVNENLQDVILEQNPQAKQPYLVLETTKLPEVCALLHSHKDLYFDHLACISGVDNGEADGRLEVIYHLTSLALGHRVVLKVHISRDLETNPIVPSLTPIWKGAEWHERECYDLFGVKFENHPDMRRILLPANWVGHPLRKDYKEQEYFHGIKVKY